MTQTTTNAWLQGLRAFVVEHRLGKPLPTPPAGDAQWAAERSILGAALATRLSEVEAIRQTRRALGYGTGADPALVLTTSAAGMAATTAVLESAGDLAALVENARDDGGVDIGHRAVEESGANHHRHAGEADIVLQC
ncbi:MAG: hypothetical protein WCL41_11680, partial [Betaproteobacteria bacterium]